MNNVLSSTQRASHGDAQVSRPSCAAAKALHRLGVSVKRLLGLAPDFAQPDLSHVQRLVFVCNSNLHRSAFAHALAGQLGLNAASFGLHTLTGQRTRHETVRAAAALGVPLEQHRAVHRRDFVPSAADLYLVMEPCHAHELLRLGFAGRRIALLGRWNSPLRPSIPKPRRMEGACLRNCFMQIQAAVSAWESLWPCATRLAPEHVDNAPDGSA